MYGALEHRQAHINYYEQSHNDADYCSSAVDFPANEAEQEQAQHSSAEDGSEFPPCFENAVHAHHCKPDSDSDETDHGGSEVKHLHMALSVILAGMQFLVKIGKNDGGR